MIGEKYKHVHIYIKINKRKPKSEVWVGRCAVCGTIIKARTYEAFRKKLELHAKKCFKRG